MTDARLPWTNPTFWQCTLPLSAFSVLPKNMILVSAKKHTLRNPIVMRQIMVFIMPRVAWSACFHWQTNLFRTTQEELVKVAFIGAYSPWKVQNTVTGSSLGQNSYTVASLQSKSSLESDAIGWTKYELRGLRPRVLSRQSTQLTFETYIYVEAKLTGPKWAISGVPLEPDC